MKASTRKPLMVGNWKMNLNHLEAIALTQKLAFTLTAKDFEAVDIAVLPPFTDLRSVQTLTDGDRLSLVYGAQDLSAFDSGAYTGDVSGPMLAKLGCTYVTVGHSERREHHGESDQTVNAKVHAAVRNGLIPIICVGEGLAVREAGQHVQHCCAQLEAAMAGLTADQGRAVVLAYEPVWAIGTGQVATPEDAQEVCQALRAQLAARSGTATVEVAAQVRILYGGSVKAANIAGIMAQPDVDGALVGGASLDAGEFSAICQFNRTSVASP